MTSTQILAALIAAATFIALAIGRVPHLRLNPASIALVGAGAVLATGNLTLIGSVANLIVAEQARKFGVTLSFGEYLKAGVPITLLSLTIVVLWL